MQTSWHVMLRIDKQFAVPTTRRLSRAFLAVVGFSAPRNFSPRSSEPTDFGAPLEASRDNRYANGVSSASGPNSAIQSQEW